MDEFLSVEQIATLPVAAAIVWFLANWLHRQFSFNPQISAMVIALIYALAVFVWPVPPPVATVQEWAVRFVVAVVGAILVVSTASDATSRLEARNARRGMLPTDASFNRRWY